MNTKGVGVNRPGAFAEYIAVPAFNVFKLPDAITDDMAAILDPLGNATHTALSFDLVGEDVLITGAGPIGIMAAVERGQHEHVQGPQQLRRVAAGPGEADPTCQAQGRGFRLQIGA